MEARPLDTLLIPSDHSRYAGRRSFNSSPLRFNSIGSEPESVSDEDNSSASSPPEVEIGRTYGSLKKIFKISNVFYYGFMFSKF